MFLFGVYCFKVSDIYVFFCLVDCLKFFQMDMGFIYIFGKGSQLVDCFVYIYFDDFGCFFQIDFFGCFQEIINFVIYSVVYFLFVFQYDIVFKVRIVWYNLQLDFFYDCIK